MNRITAKKGDTRNVFLHEVFSKGSFMFDTKDEEDVQISAQGHILAEAILEYDGEDWIEIERIGEEDYFYLTDYEDGYRFDESVLYNMFDIESADYDWNGFGTDWCGIEDTDTPEQALEKWEKYKNKFPEVTSKEQFIIE